MKNETNGDYVIYGMMSSYFTKKLEAYFLAKGIHSQFLEIDAPAFMQTGAEVGVVQFPQLLCPDGSWLTDTSLILEHFEKQIPEPALRPAQPLAAFLSDFLEDCFDEWLWAPALYYRWRFGMDSKRRSEEFSYTILSNGAPTPRFLTKRLVTWRQRVTHIKDNGITTEAHARHIEDLYIDMLDLLQPLFRTRPFLFGDRPCNADYGLFGPMFPHFGLDPTPQEIMLVRAPDLFRWLGSLWATRPEDVTKATALAEPPKDLIPITQKMGREYLPYLAANQKAFQADSATTKYQLGGLDWEVVTAPYRVFCLIELQKRYQALNEQDKLACRDFLGTQATEILSQAIDCPPEMQDVTAAKPMRVAGPEPVARLWQQKKTLWERATSNMARNRPSRARPELKREGTNWLPGYFRRYRAQPGNK